MTLLNAFRAVAVIAALGTGACSATSTQESTGEYVDSAVLATKVRAAIADDPRVDRPPLSGPVSLLVH